MAERDVQLIVGADITHSYTQLKSDIESIVNRFNSQKNAKKIKIGIQIDNKNKAYSQLLNDIKSISNRTSKSPVQAKIKIGIDKSYIQSQYRSVLKSLSNGDFSNGGGLNLIDDATLAKLKGQANKAEQVVRDYKQRIQKATASVTTGTKNLKNLNDTDFARLSTQAEQFYDELKRIETLEGEEKSKALVAVEEKISAYNKEIKTLQGLNNIEKAKNAHGIKDTKSHEVAIRQETSAYSKQLNLLKRIQEYLKTNTRVNGTLYGNQLNGMLSELNSGKSFASQDIDKMANKFKLLQSEISAAGLSGKTFSDTFTAGIKKFSSWFGVSQLVMRAVEGVKKMIYTVTELDSAMTELKKVTDLTEQEYFKFGNTASNIAKNVGASISDTINSTADFARLGYSIDESAKLAEAALIYKNVGDGIENVGEASESIISTIKAFGIEADNAMSIVDKFNEVGNNFAISSEGIGVALKKSAASLATSGNTIEESIGLVTGMNSVIQDPEVVGTALKTLTMYLRAAKTEAEDAGESTDGMASSVSELQEKILTLTHNKVDIMLDENNFKSTYQIVKEISNVWDDMAEVDQAALLKLIAGKRNANVVTSLITNFKDAEAAAKAASEATGSATAENEKYLDSIKGKKAELKASFESISSDIFDSEALKDGISALTTIVNLVDNLVKKLGVIPTLATTISAALSFKNVGELIKQFLY